VPTRGTAYSGYNVTFLQLCFKVTRFKREKENLIRPADKETGCRFQKLNI
jgi:hypothetical protein